MSGPAPVRDEPQRQVDGAIDTGGQQGRGHARDGERGVGLFNGQSESADDQAEMAKYRNDGVGNPVLQSLDNLLFHKHAERIIFIISVWPATLKAAIFVKTERSMLERPGFKHQNRTARFNCLLLEHCENSLGNTLTSTARMHIHALEFAICRLNDHGANSDRKMITVSCHREKHV
jgi:hypothetical protein